MDDKPEKNRQDEALSPKDSTSSDKPAEENSPQQLDNSKQGSQQQEIPAPESAETEGSYHDQAQNQDDELMEILAGEDIDKILSDSESALLGDAENSDQLAEDAALETIATETEEQDQSSSDMDDEAPSDIATNETLEEETHSAEPALTESPEIVADTATDQATETPDHPKAERSSNQLEIDDILSKSEDGEFAGFGMGILASGQDQAQKTEAEIPNIQPDETDTDNLQDIQDIEDSDDHKTLSDADIDALFESDSSEMLQENDSDQADQQVQSESLSAEELDELFGQTIESSDQTEYSSSDTELTAQLNEDSALLDDEELQTVEMPTELEATEADETDITDHPTETQTELSEDKKPENAVEVEAQAPTMASSQVAEDSPEEDQPETQATVINMSPDMAEQILSENSDEDDDADSDQNLTAEDIERLINESTGNIEETASAGESMDDVESLAAMAVDGVSEDSNANFMTMSDLDELLGRDPADHMSRAASTLTDQEIDHYSSKYGAEVASLDDLDDLFGKTPTAQPDQSGQSEPQSDSQQAAPEQNDDQSGEIAMITQDQLDELFESPDKKPDSEDNEPSDVSQALTKGELNQLLSAANDQVPSEQQPVDSTKEEESDNISSSPIAQVSQSELDDLLENYQQPENTKPLAKPEIIQKAETSELSGESTALSQDDLDKLFESTSATIDQLAEESSDEDADSAAPQSLNQDELDKLFEQAATTQPATDSVVESEENDQSDNSETLDQDDLDRLFEAADKLSAEQTATDPAPQATDEQSSDDSTSLSQDELDKLFAQAGGQDEATSEPQQQPQPQAESDDSASLSQDQLDQLFEQADGQQESPSEAQDDGDDSASLSQDELDKLFAQAGGDESQPTEEPQPAAQESDESGSMSQNELDELFAQASGGDSAAQAAEISADESTSLDQSELDKLFADAGGDSQPAQEDDWSAAEDQTPKPEPQVDNLDEIISQSIDSSDIVSEEQQLQQILQEQQKQTDDVSQNEIPVPEPQEIQAETTALLSDKPEPVELPVNNFDDLQTLLAHRDQHGLPADEEDKAAAAAAAAQLAAQQGGTAAAAKVSVPLKLKLYRLVVKLNSPFDKLPASYKEYAAYAAMALISASMFLLLAAKMR